MKSGEIARNLSRGAFYLSLEKLAALFSGLAYFALLLRWLGPTKYGIMTLGLSFAAVATLATGNFELFLERYAAEYRARNLFGTLFRAQRATLLIKSVLGLAAGAGLALLAPAVAGQFSTPELGMLLPWFGLMVVFDGLSTTGRATLFGLQRYRPIFFVAVVFHVVKTVLVAALWAARMGLFELAIGLVSITALQGVAFTVIPMWMLRRARDPEGAPRQPLLKPIFAYSVPLLGARATYLASQNMGKIVLGRLFEPVVVGYFSFAFQTIERFVELSQTVPSVLLPSLTHLVASRERDRLRYVFDQAFRLIQVAACCVSFIVFAFAHQITLLVGSPLFEPAVPVLRIMALVPMVRTAQQPLSMMFQALGQPATVLRLAVLKFAGELGCYFLLIPILGMPGAALANLLGAALSYAVALRLLGSLLPEGAAERARAARTNLLLVLVFMTAALGAAVWLPSAFGLAFCLLLLPIGLVAIFAFGQINRYDLVKLSSVPLRLAGLRRIRDGLVEWADRLARRFERPRPA